MIYCLAISLHYSPQTRSKSDDFFSHKMWNFMLEPGNIRKLLHSMRNMNFAWLNAMKH